MGKKAVFLCFCFAVLQSWSAIGVLGETAVVTGRQVMEMEDDRPDGDDRTSVLTMTLVNKRGSERVREVSSCSKDYGKDRKSVMVFRSPADVKGTAFLSWEYDDPSREDDKWLYMPAMKKVRRISGSSKNEYFMGSDFTYDDMGDRNVDEDAHALLGEEEIAGHTCWKVESVPLGPDDMYTRKVIWISKEARMALKAEYYDKDGLLKVYRVLDFAKVGGFWTVRRSEMENVVRKHKTLMEFSDMRYNTGLEDVFFKVSSIQRGRVR
ncbi:outer membrane lipoprotein-sorting protein [Prosthecochloris sp. N3]|uniref:Outer membrane lipoprotein-sorting protein n=3 Tax=Prosthecochloris ethylica TaxID=2743976 RepID=A0ABR9XQ49_9CHLB|nr:outer membrane lipoprotein-sorting protein [Prosthecochloris ethylica]MBF0636059.1 outer membrane lipoprotein-sorting protein [Prosthecochloris ethylica]NUK48486.1 outer membrane lipoprotein-sorting protein [Prosthecochloris ethylica]